MSRLLFVNGIHRWWIVLSLLGLLAAAVIAVMASWNVPHLSSRPRPAQSYVEGVRPAGFLRSEEPPDMNPVCRLGLMTHGVETARAMVLVHGYTNCPQQFGELGQRRIATV